MSDTARRERVRGGPGRHAGDPAHGAPVPEDARRDEAVGAVFSALADPTRRAVLRELGSASTVTASTLAATLPMTRQAIAKHLRALADAGLVVATRSGRETHYRAVPGGLDGAVGWMVDAGARWDDRLERLRRKVE